MSEAEVVQIVRQHLENQFPKVCQCCNRNYVTLRDYVLVTKGIGLPVSYDAELGNWTPTQPIGSLALANCPCGSTLTLGSTGMMLSRRLALLDWIRIETHRRRVSPSELLGQLIDNIYREVLQEPIEGNQMI